MKTTIKTSVVLLAGIFLLSSFSLSINGYKVGDKVEDFRLKNIDGKEIALADLKNARGAIVIFTCNHCPYAKAYEQRIMALDKKFASKGFPVIAISSNDPKVVPDDSYENMMKRSKEKGYTFPYLFDESQKVAKDFGATRTPHVFVLNKGEKGYEVAYIGAIDDNTEDAAAVKAPYVEDAVNSLLQGKEVAVKQTKAIGCTIKWKS